MPYPEYDRGVGRLIESIERSPRFLSSEVSEFPYTSRSYLNGKRFDQRIEGIDDLIGEVAGELSPKLLEEEYGCGCTSEMVDTFLDWCDDYFDGVSAQIIPF